MRLLDLKSAVVEILQAIEQGKRQKLPCPFFFMVGAGISHPPLPLAASIEAQCKQEAQKYGKEALPVSDSPIDSYCHWFGQAYPQPENRQLYLRGLMEGAFISRANFRLAHLLLDNTVTNLVVTTNFDDLLSRALALFGRRHIVCDHPRILERIDLRSQDVQIVHIHGSYWFYDCCNLKAEISERARGSPSTSFTMLSTLDDILRTRSPLVVGYSGWEGDVFMNALQRRMSAPLRTNVYWFCHRRRDAQSLPDWLRDSPTVCFIVPEESKAMRSTESDLSAAFGKAKSDEGVIWAAEPATYATVERDEAIMHPTAVFDELILRFKLGPPLLTQDPLRFFADFLTTSLLGDKPEEVEDDVYAIRSVVGRLRKFREQEMDLPPRTRRS